MRSKTTRASWLSFGVGGDVGAEAFEEELAGKVVAHVAGEDNEAILDGETRGTIAGGAVGIGKAGGGEVAQNVGIVDLLAAIVAAAEEGLADRVAQPL